MRKPYQSPGQDEKLILLYCPVRGLNSRPPAHRSLKTWSRCPTPLTTEAEARRLQETRETTAMMGGLPEYIYLRKVEEEEKVEGKGKQHREMEEN